VVIAGVAPVIPGTDSGSGVLVDLGALQDVADREGLLHVSANEWWISTSSPATAARTVDHRAPAGTVTRTVAPTAAEQVLQSARTVVWVAGIATALLALLTVASSLLAELRGRRAEVDVLRAVGVSARAQSRGRVIEWALLLGIGVVVGLLDGVATCALVMPGLARTAVPLAIDGLRTYLNVDGVGALVCLAALLAALAGMLLVVARTVRRQAR
jgi:predicted lysophospholipase L1 biosynthesis ABC-type transport system permease subunit